MKDNNSLKIGVGTPTILMIFVVLCMVILSVLSFQEADHNMSLVEKEKVYITNYYEAETKANEIASMFKNTAITQIEEQFNVDIDEDEYAYFYQCEIDEKKELYVVCEKESLEFKTFQVRNKEGT